jgi:hypothetical protein
MLPVPRGRSLPSAALMARAAVSLQYWRARFFPFSLRRLEAKDADILADKLIRRPTMEKVEACQGRLLSGWRR